METAYLWRRRYGRPREDRRPPHIRPFAITVIDESLPNQSRGLLGLTKVAKLKSGLAECVDDAVRVSKLRASPKSPTRLHLPARSPPVSIRNLVLVTSFANNLNSTGKNQLPLLLNSSRREHYDPCPSCYTQYCTDSPHHSPICSPSHQHSYHSTYNYPHCTGSLQQQVQIPPANLATQ
jgi:hypothetical protein